LKDQHYTEFILTHFLVHNVVP